MTVGPQPTKASIDQTLYNYATGLRNLCEQIANDQQDFVAMGTTGLEAAGYSSGDAALVLQYASYMFTIAQVFQGTFGQAPTGETAAAFDFQNALAPLYDAE